MEKTISQRYREIKFGLYARTAKKFNASPIYVSQIACGTRSGSRGKGKLIKEFLENELKNK